MKKCPECEHRHNHGSATRCRVCGKDISMVAHESKAVTKTRRYIARLERQERAARARVVDRGEKLKQARAELKDLSAAR